MVENVLVDSNYFISRLKRRENPFHELAASAEGEWEFFTCGMVILEVCRGIREPKFLKAYREAFSVMSCVPTTGRVWEKASDIAWQLDRKGIVMQASDLIIAASALLVDAAVLTQDGDFHRVPGLTVWTELPGA